jgi:uncharacterized protein YkwD
MITIRNIVVFVGTLAASGLAGSYVGLLPTQQDSAANPPASSQFVSTGDSNLRLQAPRNGSGSGGGGVVQWNIGEGCPLGGDVSDALPAAIHHHRRAQKLQPVGCDSGELSEIAAARLGDMLARHYVGVINSRGQDIATELNARHVPFSSAAIIVFKGCLGDPADNHRAIEAWKGDPSTRAVLNNPTWYDFGFASTPVVTSRVGGQKGYYLQVVIFRKR